MERRRLWIGLAGAAAAALAVLVIVVLRSTGSGSDLLAPGGPPPGAATEAVGLLASPDSAVRRSAFDPDSAALFGEEGGPEIDAGGTIRLDEDGWRSEIDGFANARGQLVGAAGSSQPVEIGFAHADDRWLIVYVAERGAEG
jgi:hypothetical protein